MTAHSALTGLTADDHPQYLLKSLIDAKGDLYVASADNVLARLPVGANGKVLTADSAQTLGVKWDWPTWWSSDLTIVDNAITNNFFAYTTLTANATIHTKATTYTDVIASTAAVATMIRVQVKNSVAANAVATSQLIDIATGTIGNEVNIVSNLNAGFLVDVTTAFAPAVFWFPVAIPAGTRISARSQALISSDTVDIHITTYSGTNRTGSVETIGASTATSQGVNVASAISNGVGTWQQIIASTAREYSGLLYAVGGAADTTIELTSNMMDIGTGANPSEVVIWPNRLVNSNTTETVTVGSVLPQSLTIPVGTRIVARMSHTTATAQSYDVILYGLY